MNTLVKICGIRTVQGAKAAVEAGADFIGLNFVPTSRRFIDLETAREIRELIPETVQVVGIFKDDQLELVNFIGETLNLDAVQLHGKEDLAYVKEVRIPVIKVFALHQTFDVDAVAKQFVDYKDYVKLFLIDRLEQGNGPRLDLSRVKELSRMFPVILGGGLNPENVRVSAQLAQPYGVDVAGGIETDGMEDAQKILQFIREVKE